MNRLVAVLLLLSCFWQACQSDVVFTPKPRTFPKIDFPNKAYQPFQEGYCQFSFQYPTYATIERDTAFFEELPINPCWFDIVIPNFDARVHCSYFPIENKPATFEKLRDDAFRMVNTHNIKASYIDEYKIEKSSAVTGFVFNIEGPAASPFQFYLTDSTNHFLRGALYFNTQARPDSLAPIFEFLKLDIMNMINTFEWESSK